MRISQIRGCKIKNPPFCSSCKFLRLAKNIAIFFFNKSRSSKIGHDLNLKTNFNLILNCS